MLRTSNPAPTSSTRASVTSPTTSAFCRRRLPPIAPGASSRSDCSMPGAEARHAGRIPNTTPVRTASPRPNARTGPSSPISVARGSARGQTASRALSPDADSTTPTAPAASASSVLSVSSWRTSRPRPAPRARRTASSRRRAVARASRRLAALAQAISSTRATAPASIRRRWLTSPIAASRSSWTSKPLSRIDRPLAEGAGGPRPGPACSATIRCRPPLPPESAALRRAPSSLTSATTRSRAAPGARRATAVRKCIPRFVSAWGFCARNSPIGVHTCTSALGNSNPAGMTPITVKLRPSSEIDLPRIAGSRPKLVTQSPWLNSARGVRSSAAVKACPISGRTCSTSHRSAVAAATWTSRASPAPVRL